MPGHGVRAPVGPDVIGGYEVLLPIGTGGMGNVFLVRKRIVGDVFREFALKLIRPDLNDATDWSQLLLEEAKIAARMRHPNVVSVLEAADGDRGVYLVMDYVEGVNLSGLLKLAGNNGGRLPLRIVARVLRDALAGLHAVHELTDAAGEPLRIVHRDVSPQNLLVGADGTTRLTDFGIAKARSRPDTTNHGTVKGKLRYMAPEQALGLELDRRVDVWAAGVVAWEAIAGERLFQGDTDEEALIRALTSTEVPSLAERRPDVPAEIDAAVAGALSAKRERRCPSALELMRRLDVAWAAADGVADAAEVAEYVGGLASEELALRRQKVRDAEKAHSSAPSATPATGVPTPAGATPREVSVSASTGPESDVTKTANVLDTPSTPRRRRVSRALYPALAIVAAAVGVGASQLLFKSQPPAALQPTGLVSSTTTTPESTAAANLSTTPTPDPSVATDPSSPRVIEVRSDVPLREVSADGHPLLLDPPSHSASVQAGRHGAQIRVQAVAIDGRRAEQTVAADASEVAFAFGPPPPRPPQGDSDRRLLPYHPSGQRP